MRQPHGRRQWTLLALVPIGLGAAFLLRKGLLAEREALELTPKALESGPGSTRGALAERQVVALSAGLGVVRPLAIDFLWLRAIHLQEKGEYFEAASLSNLIAGLEPRLAEVWTFQARNLTYNIPPGFPAAERFPWILKGIQLLRDDALLYNPANPSIHLDLAMIFLHKIGLDYDGAGSLYRSRLALMFEAERGSPAGIELRRAWKLDAGRVQRLEDRLKSPLDFRVSASHAFYWASSGLDVSPAPTGWLRRRLEAARAGALFQLLGSGRPVQGTDGPGFAFMPELAFEDAALAAVEAGAAGESREDLTEALASVAATGVLARLILRGETEARDRFTSQAARLEPVASTLDDLVMQWATGESDRTPDRSTADLLDGACLLEAAREPELSAGLRRLARIVWQRRAAEDGTGGVPAFDAELERARKRAESGARLDPLPFGLEQIAPAARRREAP